MEFKFRKVHITKVIEVAGELFEETVGSPVCDFCFDTRVAWEHPCRRFSIDAIDFHSDGPFAACSPCSLLIDLGAWGALERRILQSWMALGVQPYHTMTSDIKQLVLGFSRNRIGSRQPFTPAK